MLKTNEVLISSTGKISEKNIWHEKDQMPAIRNPNDKLAYNIEIIKVIELYGTQIRHLENTKLSKSRGHRYLRRNGNEYKETLNRM